LTPLKLQQPALILFAALGLTLSSCWGGWSSKNLPTPEDPIKAEAYVPVYSTTTVSTIKSVAPQPIVHSGKIYVWNNLLFQIEQYKGIHVINYSDRSNPVKLGFIEVRGCNELAVKGTHLITNNIKDLVTIDISDPASVKEVGRMKNAFPMFYVQQLDYPMPPDRGWYVCPDYSQGEVTGWKLEKNVKNAYCRY
jgi:hypothetical protein